MQDVVVGALDRAGRLRHDQHLGAGLAGDETGGVGRIPVLEQDDPDFLVPHSTDEPGQMLRGGRNAGPVLEDRKSTRLNSSHTVISYAVFCLKKKNAVHLSVESDPQGAVL